MYTLLLRELTRSVLFRCELHRADEQEERHASTAARSRATFRATRRATRRATDVSAAATHTIWAVLKAHIYAVLQYCK